MTTLLTLTQTGPDGSSSAPYAAVKARFSSIVDREEDLEDVGVELVERLVAGAVLGGEQRVPEILVVDHHAVIADVGAALVDPGDVRDVGELVGGADARRPAVEGRELAIA